MDYNEIITAVFKPSVVRSELESLHPKKSLQLGRNSQKIHSFFPEIPFVILGYFEFTLKNNFQKCVPV